MIRKIYTNIVQSIIEKFFIIGTQFILSFFLVRLLKREDYGIIGVVAGYFVFINLINVSLESIILRDHKNYENNLEKYFVNFIFFNIIKSLIFIIISIVLSLFLVKHYKNINFLYGIFSTTFILIANSIVAPFIVYTTAKFNQKIVTKFAIIRAFINIILTCGLFFYPSLLYVFTKDLIVSILYIIIWIIYSNKIINYKKIKFKEYLDFTFIKETLFEYSLWTHINGVVTQFIYKSDTLFLSFFVSLEVIGDYNIALTSANVANILPMILGYQNSVALSHSKNMNQAYKISNTFIRLSMYIGVLTLFGFTILGKFYLRIITGQQNVDSIYTYMMFIVTGLVIVKSFASPLVAFINIKGSVKRQFKTVLIPTLLITIILYYFGAKIYGAFGVAVENILVSIVWLILLLKEVRVYGYDFKSVFAFKNDYLYIKNIMKN